ncbi:hypothetical protein LCGC14_0663930 [marine sediment metagenome]|uniref:Uncharacterized protein n=1 Tax=marine sediment metagenome TaxID=412755 RepID=A0A0F9QXX2_9ZZZZ
MKSMEEKNKEDVLDKFLGEFKIVKRFIGDTINLWEEKDKKERFVRGNLAKLYTQADQMYRTYKEIQNNNLHKQDPHIIEYVNKFGPEMSGIVDYSRIFYEESLDLHKKIDYMTGATSSSIVNMGTGIAFTDTYFNHHREDDAYKPLIINWEERGLVNDKDDLLVELEKIDSKLREFFERIWDSFLFKGVTRGEILPAHAMREFMSDFLQVLDPTNLIKSMPWCEFSEGSGNPTQRSKVIFAILENLNKFIWKKDKFKPYIEIATKYRDLYIKLNKCAHYRDDELPPDIRIDLANYIKLLQNNIIEIINLRESQYSNEIPTVWDHIYQSFPDGAIMNIRFNCTNCNRELVFYSYELPPPYMMGDKHEDSYRYGENDSIECYKCGTIFEIGSYNSIPGWMICFEGEKVPEFFKFRILKHFNI